MHILRLFLDRYQDVLRNSLGLALTTAILSDRNDATEMLLAAGANVNGERAFDNVEFNPLSAAISRKNSPLIRNLLASGAAVGFKEISSEILFTVLPAVVCWGDHLLIQDIINAGANVNVPGYPQGGTALAIAILRGDMRIVGLLIDSGADVNANAALTHGPTAPEAASRNKDLRMVQFLIGLGAESDEWSLTEAISGSPELVNTLVAARLDQYRRFSNGYGSRALQHAINTKTGHMINILLAKGIDANAIIQPGFEDENSNPFWRRPTIVFEVSAFGYAIQKDNSDDLSMVQMLLKGGADPNGIVTNSFESYRRFETRTALLEAIHCNNLATVKKLVMEGADVNLETRRDIIRTPIQAAAEIGNIDIVHLLLEHGANVNAPPHYRYGATALQFAAIGGYTGIALLLLEKGANVNALPAQVDGRTALEGAAEHGRNDMVRILLITGARTSGVGGEQYERALKFAAEKGQASTCRLLERYMEQPWESLVDWDAE